MKIHRLVPENEPPPRVELPPPRDSKGLRELNCVAPLFGCSFLHLSKISSIKHYRDESDTAWFTSIFTIPSQIVLAYWHLFAATTQC